MAKRTPDFYIDHNGCTTYDEAKAYRKVAEPDYDEGVGGCFWEVSERDEYGNWIAFYKFHTHKVSIGADAVARLFEERFGKTKRGQREREEANYEAYYLYS